jgi:hypothetical protein
LHTLATGIKPMPLHASLGRLSCKYELGWACTNVCMSVNTVACHAGGNAWLIQSVPCPYLINVVSGYSMCSYWAVDLLRGQWVKGGGGCRCTNDIPAGVWTPDMESESGKCEVMCSCVSVWCACPEGEPVRAVLHVPPSGITSVCINEPVHSCCKGTMLLYSEQVRALPF